MAKIYLSATYTDLKTYRDAVYNALRQMQHDVVTMEDYVATGQRSLDKCLADVAACDLYVGLFAWRYGYIPSEENPQQKSITELEYRKASADGKSCLIFLLDDDAPWSPSMIDAVTGEGNHGEYINKLREEFTRDKLVSFFKTSEHLASLVSRAVHLWEREYKKSPITQADYFEQRTAEPGGHIQPFDHLPCPDASLADLELGKVSEFFRRDLVQRQEDFQSEVSIQAQLVQFGLLRESHLTYGALLCFGQNPQTVLTGATTRCIYWRGNTRNSGYLDDRDCRGDLLAQFESSLNFLRKCLRFSRIIGKEGRREQYEIPLVALQEAIANALVHREYANRGVGKEYEGRTDNVQMEVFDNRVEIKSPGSLPPPLTLERLRSEDISHPRNPLIARIFYLYGNVERVGSGIKRMQEAMEEAGLPPPRFELSDAQTFKVILDRPQQVPDEILESSEFGQLLNVGLEGIAITKDLTLEQVIAEISNSVEAKNIYLIQKWRQGQVPISKQVAILAQICVRTGGMDQVWLRSFLKAARYPDTESFIAELYPQSLQEKLGAARINSEQIKAYRQALHGDPRISGLQILDMSRPLEVTGVYVSLRVHQDTRLDYSLGPETYAAEAQRDPNVLLQADFKHLERRASKAIEPDEAIRIYKHCVIVGDPGAGKTTLLKYLALQSIENQLPGLPDLPIHIELNAFANSQYHDLLEFASSIWEVRYGFPKAEALEAMRVRLQEGKALLLLDALDETVTGGTKEESEASYKQVAKAITDTATRYHQSPIVVTARKAGYHQRIRLMGFTELEVLDFRSEDIEKFVNQWFAHQSSPFTSASATDLNSILERNPRIQALAANPLLLSLIAIVYEAQLDLPNRRAELYKQCVDILLSKWDASRDIRRRAELKQEHKRRLLAEVAWHFHLQGQRYFPENELLMVIGTFLPTVELEEEQNHQILEEIAAENGLLKEQAPGWQGFLHLTLQEYFVAQYAVDHNQLDTLLTHRGDPWWEEVILLYAGCVSDASPLLQQLLGSNSQEESQDDLFHTDLLTAGRCLAAHPTILKVLLRQEVISRLFSLLAATPYLLLQKQVAETLTEIGGRPVISRLLELLADKETALPLRLRIATALGTIGEQAIAPDLLKLLGDEQVNLALRLRIATALGALGERSVVPQLLKLLANEQVDTDVRLRIADTLGTLGDRSVIPQLLKLLANERVNLYVRSHIADTLGALGERSIIPQLLKLLQNKHLVIDLYESIAAALGALGERSVVPNLLNLLADEQVDTSVRLHIIDTLGALGERSTIPDLLNLLADEQVDTDIRLRIADTLGALGDRSIVPELLDLLKNKPLVINVYDSIATALGALGERSIVPELLNLLADEQVDTSVRIHIIDTLGALGERSIVPELLNLLSDEQINLYVRLRIADTLGYFGERSVIPQLLKLLANEKVDTDVRRGISATLGQLADDEASLRAMSALLDQPNIADAVYETLWTMSRRMEVRLLVKDKGEAETEIEVTHL